MAVKLKTKINTNEIFKSYNKLRSSFPAASRAALIEFAGESQKKVNFITSPVKKGNLRTTIRVEIKPKSIKLLAGGIKGKGSPSVFVDYAKFVNDGTSKIVPRLFMERGVLLAGQDVDSFSAKILRSWLREVDFVK